MLSSVVRQDVTLQKKGQEFVGHCPFHNEKTGSFFVNDEKGTFYCFGCGASGDIIEYLMRKRGIQFMQAVEILSEISGIKIPEKLGNSSNVSQNQQDILQRIANFFKENLRISGDAMTYCTKRGITKELIDKFSIGYAPKNTNHLLQTLKEENFSREDIVNSGVFLEKDGKLICRFRDRITFPVFDKKGCPIAFGGRAIQKEATPKYINSPETTFFQKRDTLYGYNIAIKNISKTVPFILVEGYMDVVMMNKYDFNTAIASMGTAFSQQHLEKIWRYCKNPVICLDGDRAGYNAMVRIALLALPHLQPGQSLKFCEIPGNDDPDSFLKNHPKSEMEKLILNSKNLVDFIWDYFSNKLNEINNKTPENIAEWKKEIFAHIDEIQNTDIKSFYKRDIKERIFNVLRSKDRTFANSSISIPIRIDKSEKMVLREATLLYILVMHPSIVPAIVEELADIEFSNNGFEQLRRYMVGNPDLLDFSAFDETISELKRMTFGICACDTTTDDEAIGLWRDVFNVGVARKRVAEDLKMAKSECDASFDETAWNRFKALKLDFLGSKSSDYKE